MGEMDGIFWPLAEVTEEDGSEMGLCVEEGYRNGLYFAFKKINDWRDGYKGRIHDVRIEARDDAGKLKHVMRFPDTITKVRNNKRI